MSIVSATLTATFNPATGTVTLTATALDGAPTAAHAWTLVRTDALGSAPVRVPTGLTLTGDGMSGTYVMVATDHECALSGLVSYELRITDESATTRTATASLTPTGDQDWLTFPRLPQYSLALPPVGGYEVDYQPRDRFFQPLDRDAFVPVFGQFGTRSGRLEFLAPTYAEALRIVRAYKRLRVAQLRVTYPPAASMYHALTRIGMRQLEPGSTEWLVSGEFREVPRPSGDLLGTLGWSYADTTDLGETYAATTVTFPDYADRTIGAP